MLVGIKPHHGLKNAGSDLVGECDQPDLGKIKIERAFQQWVNCQYQRLNQVVEKMRKTDGTQHAETSATFFRKSFGYRDGGQVVLRKTSLMVESIHRERS